MELKTEVLIIGSGIAGLFSAIKVAQFADVILVTKKEKSESNTNYAQGGIASVIDPNDTYQKHIDDTNIAGAGLCKPEAVDFLVKEGPACIQELIDVGTQFTLVDGKLDLAKEGGHSYNRIVHAKDLTGKEIERALIEKINSLKNITVYEDALAIDLITEHNVSNLKQLPINSRHCWGAYVLFCKTNTVVKIISKATFLATGGIGQVYLHTTNPSIATGDGFAMAYRAGARVANMEFIQFHPTSLYQGERVSDDGKAFLISEALRGFGARLKNRRGELFMRKYDSREELAPRDIVARAIDSEMKKYGDDFVYLDISHKPAEDIINHFPNIYSKCNSLSIDITKDSIPVVPAAHYACGGVVVDLHSRSSLSGLYAIGEVSMTGVHGANRLASNSLLEALVFAHSAADSVKSYLQNYSVNHPEIPDWDDSGALSAEETVLISFGKKELKQLMWDLVGIVRSNLRLASASSRIEILYKEVESFYKKTKVFNDLLELRNMITCSYLITKSAILRKESRGLHYTVDYPSKCEGEPIDTVIQNTYQKS